MDPPLWHRDSMQTVHGFMRTTRRPCPREKPPGIAARGLSGKGLPGAQAMYTAIQASRKISAAPTIGSTIGIMGTTDSTASCGS